MQLFRKIVILSTDTTIQAAWIELYVNKVKYWIDKHWQMCGDKIQIQKRNSYLKFNFLTHSLEIKERMTICHFIC